VTTRYEPHGVEAEFQPGSRGRVLRNALGIIRVRDMQLAESQALWLAQRQAIDTISDTHRFTAEDIRLLHRIWMGPIYPWAGEYRSVNIGKGGFQFAGAHLIPGLMSKLERGVLARFTPCRETGAAEALAAVHAELILIHPFRDGNGRLARLLALLMGLQAGLPPLDFSPLDGHGKKRYIAAIHAALGRNYRPLAALFERIIERTRKRVASSRQ
jgi:cell filamentation protein